jgi:ATP-dependent exoDNAse (exonuclease V) beta subunit
MTARHVMIRASAGSGKTYALTNRFVGLLAAGARPERIVALTFTRKAAGEFFDEILRKLARAAETPAAAEKLAQELGRPELTAREFLVLLRAVADAMHRLRLGTLDGFFGRLVRAFPFELGLTGDFEVLQEHAARTERRRVWQRMFARGPGGLDDAQREFIEAFKRATFGAEEKQLGARLDGFLDAHQEKFLAAPDGAAWGAPDRIWPEGCEWLPAPALSLAAAAAALRTKLERRALPEKQLARWTAFFTALAECAPGTPLPDPVAYLLKNTFLVWADVRQGAAEITVERKKCALGPAECADLVVIVTHLMAGELGRQLEKTRGIHAVLARFESVYHDTVRRAGKLTFGDIQRLLEPKDGGWQLAGGNEGGDGRLMIDYRLDGQFDHWLLDEFQDTSFGQWRVLENLIDEAVQDPAGGRTFFCVGDVKQAIFAWREGDRRLFGEILSRYNDAAPGTIAEAQLVQSYRSGPAVIAMVNAVFGHRDAIAELLPGPASADWNHEWRAHESARPQLAGYAAWEHVPDESARLARTVELLLAIDPIARGLECAVLVQSNAMATALADYLRQEGGIPALAESDLHVGTDNPLGAALLALVQAAAYPGDRFAAEHLAMTPLGALLAADGVTSPEALTRRVLGQIHADGFEQTMACWVRRLATVLAADDAFSRERGRQFVAAAALFDATGSRDVAEFGAFIERHVVRGTEVAGVVRVMRVH